VYVGIQLFQALLYRPSTHGEVDQVFTWQDQMEGGRNSEECYVLVKTQPLLARRKPSNAFVKPPNPSSRDRPLSPRGEPNGGENIKQSVVVT
jgi:hypothetical protein